MFKIGDTVKWTSQACGRQKTKIGEIVGVVPPGWRNSLLNCVKNTTVAQARTKYITGPIDSAGLSRDHQSYLVAVKTGKTDAAKKTLYWPRVSGLKKVG